jgi:hypothetical protein
LKNYGDPALAYKQPRVQKLYNEFLIRNGSGGMKSRRGNGRKSVKRQRGSKYSSLWLAKAKMKKRKRKTQH